MNRGILTFALTALVLFQVSCQDPVETKLDSIQKLESQIKAEPIEEQSGIAMNLVDHYVAFAQDHPKHKQAPLSWFKAGEVSEGLKEYEEAVRYFKEVYTNYPSHKKAPVALFVEGFIYQDKIKNNALATERFNQLMESYPEHELAEQAEAYLNLMKLRDEDLLEFLENKQKTKDK